ncbi:head completion/stabilization protein [Janthinobacterium sp. B9-8]|uniref:head completion/stabilization protein n=1 Tax=Janthinobacterium sp. B9-8 TaxID=1236179 RepID=UPI00061CE935|nr:head completion/stabilization protein [Janthinobacterium sp. B9-8]AMC35316.1 hypothetical protein VN23_12200 [Janthinobacterium sp. B9-8]
MGFIAAQKNDEVLEPIIKNSGFWPDIDIADARLSLRLDGTVTPPRLKMALIAAMASANQDLRKYKAKQIGQGFNDLTEVDSDTIDGQNILVGHYTRAVYCLAKANLTERYRDFDSTGDGHNKADQLSDPIEDLNRDARWAIRDLIGSARATVELL